MMTPWEMGQAAMPLILAAVLLRLLLKKRMPRAAFAALWSVALVRLLVPLRVPFRFSIHMLVHRVEDFLSGITPLVPKAPAAQAIQPIAASGADAAIPAAGSLVQPIQTNINWYIWIWLAVAVALLAYHLVGYVRLRRRFAQSLLVGDARLVKYVEAQGLLRHVSLRQTDQIDSPLTYGVLHPVILLPRRTLSLPEEALDFMLDHEMAHIRRFDAATKLLLVLALCLHWYNPLVWLMRFLAVRDIEVACDERVVRMRGQQKRAAYALTLLGMEERRGIVSPLTNSFSQYATEERINAIMNMKKKSLFSTIIALVMILGLTLVFATSAMAADVMSAQPLVPATPVGTAVETAPAAAVEWYTYEEYAAWLAAERQTLQALVNSGVSQWTQETANEAIRQYEDILRLIGEGMLVSKPMEDGSMLMSDGGMASISAVTSTAQAATVDIASTQPAMRTYSVTDAATLAPGAILSISPVEEVTPQAAGIAAVYSITTVADDAHGKLPGYVMAVPAQTLVTSETAPVSFSINDQHGEGTVSVTITEAAQLLQAQPAQTVQSTGVPGVSLVQEGINQVTITRVDDQNASYQGSVQGMPIQIQRADTVTVSAEAMPVQDYTVQYSSDSQALTAPASAYAARISLGEMITVDLGPYGTAQALHEAVATFCQAQVAAGLLTAQDASAIMAQYP